MRRVVVTGLGMVSPLGNGVDITWDRLLKGESGAGPITKFDPEAFKCKIACEVPFGEGEGEFNPDAYMVPKEQRKLDTFLMYAVAAADEAIAHSGYKPETDEEKFRYGTLIGSGIGGLPAIADTSVTLHERGPRRVGPFFIPSALINLASGQVSIRHDLRGPNHSVVTACSTGAHAIGDAARLIMWDDADVMVTGGTEATIAPLGIAGFDSARALSTHFNDDPAKGSRPWDKDRDGFVMGEGAGVVVLEELEHAKARGATIYAEVTGYGLSGDAHHVTAPHPEGSGGFRAMKMALKRAGLSTADIDYINAHGTSTPLGDELELGAVKKLFGQDAYDLTMSSTKSAVGHLLGAAGAVEAIFSIKAIHHNVAPPTLNLDNPSEGCDLDLAPHQAKEKPIKHALSNSFGFGGTNASVIFSEVA